MTSHFLRLVWRLCYPLVRRWWSSHQVLQDVLGHGVAVSPGEGRHLVLVSVAAVANSEDVGEAGHLKELIYLSQSFQLFIRTVPTCYLDPAILINLVRGNQLADGVSVWWKPWVRLSVTERYSFNELTNTGNDEVSLYLLVTNFNSLLSDSVLLEVSQVGHFANFDLKRLVK